MDIYNKLEEITDKENFDIDLQYYYGTEDTYDEYYDKICEVINEEEIIYYSKAISYLQENDNSLSDSLEIAIEYGYTIEDLNSELLATLLYQEKLREKFFDIIEPLEEFFNN